MEQLPLAFLEQMKGQLREEYQAFLEALSSPAPTSIRRNPYKHYPQKENFEKVKWYSNGVYLPDRPNFALDPSWHAGSYYVQEASSMFLAQALIQWGLAEKQLSVLDLCAAPGGKAGILLDELHPESFVLANELIGSRTKILIENGIKWGRSNLHISQHDPADFGGLNDFFDLVLVDAPCSGEGLFRKDHKARGHWSKKQVRHCALRQQRILDQARSLVRPGGFLIYCTCTYNQNENLNMVKWILEAGGFEMVSLNIPEDWGIRKIHDNRAFGYQFYPHVVRGEGFFLAGLQKIQTTYDRSTRQKAAKKLKAGFSLKALNKKQILSLGDWIESPYRYQFYKNKTGQVYAFLESHMDDVYCIDHHLNRLRLGNYLGQFKGKSFLPSHDLAMGQLLKANWPGIELNKDQALQYLRKESLPLTTQIRGWVLAKYQGLNLGWLNVLPNRINNYYPKNWRLRLPGTF